MKNKTSNFDIPEIGGIKWNGKEIIKWNLTNNKAQLTYYFIGIAAVVLILYFLTYKNKK
jgi:hypothetical protein